jgi:predicted Zn-dependent protease
MLPIIGLFGIGSGSVRKQEADADRFATDMLYRTKFDALSALAVLPSDRVERSTDMGLTHPIGIERMAILRRETARLKMLDQAATGGNVANHAPLGGSLARN